MRLFVEKQRFPLWADLLLWAGGALAPALILLFDAQQFQPALLSISVVLLLLWLMLFRMVTTVDQDQVVVTFGWIPSYSRRIPLADIKKAKAVSYSPIREYGGWGIRGIPVSCLNARGSLGVKLILSTGRSLLIGSQRPQELLAALRAAP